MMSFYLVSPLVGISNGSLELATAAIGIYLLRILNKTKISYSFSHCFGRTTTDFYELMIAYRRYFMKLFMFLDGVSCEESVNNDVLAQW